MLIITFFDHITLIGNENTRVEAIARSYGETVSTIAYNTHSISVVVSYCETGLDWLLPYLNETMNNLPLTVFDVSIISKCGKGVSGIDTLKNAIQKVDILQMPNVGRCDHTYAYWIQTNYHSFIEQQDQGGVVLFLKDNNYLMDYAYSFSEMLRTSLVVGFSCMSKTIGPEIGYHHNAHDIKESLVLHRRKTIENFTLKTYSRLERDKNDEFENANITNLGEWAIAIGLQYPTTDFIPVCYKGNFAVTKRRLLKQSHHTWNAMVLSLSRGDNIIEGHYAERLWAAVLSYAHEDDTLELISKILPPYISYEDNTENGMYGHIFVDVNSSWASLRP
jgi:hypothetical protein